MHKFTEIVLSVPVGWLTASYESLSPLSMGGQYCKVLVGENSTGGLEPFSAGLAYRRGSLRVRVDRASGGLRFHDLDSR